MAGASQGRVSFLKLSPTPRLVVVVVFVVVVLTLKNRSDLYPVPFSFLLFKAKKRISVVIS